jgi:hypothetical protein
LFFLKLGRVTSILVSGRDLFNIRADGFSASRRKKMPKFGGLGEFGRDAAGKSGIQRIMSLPGAGRGPKVRRGYETPSNEKLNVPHIRIHEAILL